MPNTNISIFTTKWGHYSIGQAVFDALEDKKYQINFNSVEVDKLSNYSYNFTYQLFPSLTKIPFKVSGNEKVSGLLIKTLHKIYSKKIKSIFQKQNPQVVINTYFAFNSIFEELSKKYKFLYINIIADPRSIHKVTVSRIGYNFVFDKTALKNCIKFKVPKEKCIQSGWFVRKKFTNPLNKTKIRKELGIKSNYLCLCAIGGSEGTYSILKIVPALIELKKKVQIIFICGNNRKLFSSVSALSKIMSYRGSNATILPVGFTNEIHKYIQVADLVIGKAGPNLLFETVATRTPFFAISHIAGQEDGNLEIIKKYRLGFVEENQVKAIKLTRKIIENPKILKRFDKNVSNMAEYNKKAGDILNEFIKNKMNT